MIRCRVARGLIEAAQERELELSARFELEEHVVSCAACAERERRARRLQEWLEGPGDPLPVKPDVESAVEAVFVRLERGEGSAWRPRRPRRFALVVAGSFAAACAVLVLAVRPAREPMSAGSSPANPAPLATGEPEWDAARVEVQVRVALRRCFASAGVDAPRAVAHFHEETREAAREGWPVRRFVEEQLESPDPGSALAAVRCLAALGQPSAVAALERALVRADRAATTDLAGPRLTRAELERAAVLTDRAMALLEALGSLGDAAVPCLERALSSPALASGAVLELCRIGGPRAAAALERAARSASPALSHEALLDALTSTGPAAVASLMSLAAEADARGASSTDFLARLPLVKGAGPELAALVARGRLPADLAYRALLVLRPPEALPWLEERALHQRERGPALQIMASLTGTLPLDAALRLVRGGRVPREDVLVLLTGLLEREGERGLGFTQELVARGEPEAARDWLALLIESEHPAAAAALVPLVSWPALAPDERQWAALAVGELGSAADAERLLTALCEPAARDARLTAACLLTIHAGLGDEGVERFLGPCSPTSAARVLAALESRSRSGAAVRVHRVARALDGALAELADLSTDKKAVP